MPDKPYDWRDDPALSHDAYDPDLPPLPNPTFAPEPAGPPKSFVPPRFTPDVLAALRQATEEVKQATLNQHLARRARIPDGSEAAAVLDERISQIRGALNERTGPSASVAKDAADLGPAESAADQHSHRQMVDDATPASMAAPSPAPRRRAGRKPNSELNERIRNVLQQFPNWRDQPEQMEGVCEALDRGESPDKGRVPFPLGSRKAVAQNWTGWMQAFSLDPEWVRKALQHRSH